MFKDNSRYAKLPIKEHVSDEGVRQAYVARRFLPRPETLMIAGTEEVSNTDRLDLIAARVYGDPTQYWRIVDATTEFDPPGLTDEPGTRLRIPMILPE